MKKKQGRLMIDAAALGIYIATCICIGLVGGNWVDKKLNTSPLFLVTGLFAGIVAAGMEVWRIVKKISKEDQ